MPNRINHESAAISTGEDVKKSTSGKLRVKHKKLKYKPNPSMYQGILGKVVQNREGNRV